MKQATMTRYIYFSATGTTETVMTTLGATISSSTNITLRMPAGADLCFAQDDLVFLGFPVFGGRVPAIVLSRLTSLQGNGCKAVVVAVYGNRHYDDAIKEMQFFAEQHGCHVVANIAAVAQHSIAPTIAAGRPDATDIANLHKIKVEIEQKLLLGTLTPLPCREEENYQEYRPAPIVLETAGTCTLCGTCVGECPVGAIRIEEFCSSNPELCILCMRCVAICPSVSRHLPVEMLKAMTTRIESRSNGRRETEVFWQ